MSGYKQSMNAFTLSGSTIAEFLLKADNLLGLTDVTQAWVNLNINKASIDTLLGNVAYTDNNNTFTEPQSISQGDAEPFALERISMNRWVFRITHGGLGIDPNSLIIKPSNVGSASDFAIKTTTVDSGLPDFRISKLGNLNVGVVSDLNKVHIKNDSGNAIIRLESAGVNGNKSGIRFQNSSDTNNAAGGIYSLRVGGTEHDLLFETWGNPESTERMRILSGGNVGIGLSNPSEKLEVNGNIKTSRFISTQTTGTAPFTISSSTLVTNLNSDLLDNQHLVETSGHNGVSWGRIPYIKTDGVIEVGKIIDFHNSSNSGIDFSTRLLANSGVSGIVVNLPSSNGTLALTSHNHTLDSLSNTSISSNSTGEILKWNGSVWVNNTLSEANIETKGTTLPLDKNNIAVAVPIGIDFNAIPSGVFMQNVNTGGTSNAPSGYNGGVLISSLQSDITVAFGAQMVMGRDLDSWLIRGMSNGVYSDWNTLATREWVGVQNYVTTSDNPYVSATESGNIITLTKVDNSTTILNNIAKTNIDNNFNTGQTIQSGFNNVDLRFKYNNDLEHYISTNVNGGVDSVNRMDFNISTGVSNTQVLALRLQGDGTAIFNNTVTAPNFNGLWNGENKTQLLTGYATEGYVTSQINTLIDSAPGTLDTLNELAAALGDDPNFATTITTSIGDKVSKSGDTMSGDLVIEKTAPTLRLFDNNITTSSYPTIQFDTVTNQGISLYHNEFDGELPTAGYGLVVGPSPNNTQFPSGGGISFNVLGEIYAGGTGTTGNTLGVLHKVYHDNYHPVADRWTTPRSHTVTLTGDVTGTNTQTVNGSGNKTWTINTVVANDSHSHSNYVEVGGDIMTGTLTAPTLKLTNDASNTFNHRITVYDDSSNSYGMMLWNSNGTTGEWATMIYGPSSGSKRISFGRLNTATPTLHSHVTEGAYFDLDDWTLRLTSNIYVNNQIVYNAANLTLATLGYTGANDANNYVHPSYTSRSINTTGAQVLDVFTSDSSGHVTNITTREITYTDIGAMAYYNGMTTIDFNLLDNGITRNTGGVNSPSGHQTVFTALQTGDNYGWQLSNTGGNYDFWFRSVAATNTWNSWVRIYNDNYHPIADKWTTPRIHTVTLTGDVTGTNTQYIDGSGNKTWTINAAVADDSHSHSNYVLKVGDSMSGTLVLDNNRRLQGRTTANVAQNLAFIDSNNFNVLGNVNLSTRIEGLNSTLTYRYSGTEKDIYHSGNANLSTVDWATKDLTVHGNLTIEGTTFNANTQTVLIEDNLLVINNGETGVGVTSTISGIQVDRGTATDYQFIFDETDDYFKIGEIGDLQVVATRPYVDAVENQLVNYLPLSGGTLTGDLTLSSGAVRKINLGTSSVIRDNNSSDLIISVNTGTMYFRPNGDSSSVNQATFDQNGKLLLPKVIIVGGTSTQFLKADGSLDNTNYQTSLTNPITGTGTRTANYHPRFDTNTNQIENSIISDNSVVATVHGQLHVNGQIIASAASLQVNGFMRTGNILIHEGGLTPTTNAGTITNTSGSIEWESQTIYHAGNSNLTTVDWSTKDLFINKAKITNQENLDVDVGTEVIATVSKLDYDAIFFDYVIKNGVNIRVGTVVCGHDGTNLEFNETSTQDLGDTTNVTLSVDINGNDIRLLATTTSSNWVIKTLIRSL